MQQNKGLKLRVSSVDMSNFDRGTKSSPCLKISNLSPRVSEKQLTEFIRKKSKKSPQSVDIRRHLLRDFPTFAVVQMETVKEAEMVIKKLQMSSLEGQKMWIEKFRGPNSDRCEHLKGCHKSVCLRNLPLDFEGWEVRKLCAEHGDVESVEKADSHEGYALREARVHMDTVEGADAVFEALNQSQVNGRTITTAYCSGYCVSSKYKVILHRWSQNHFSQNHLTPFLSKSWQHALTYRIKMCLLCLNMKVSSNDHLGHFVVSK